MTMAFTDFKDDDQVQNKKRKRGEGRLLHGGKIGVRGHVVRNGTLSEALVWLDYRQCPPLGIPMSALLPKSKSGVS